MYYTALLFFACILAGFALLKVPVYGVIAGLAGFLEIVGVLVILVFAFALLYIGFKTLFSRTWR
ncbi:hypothetical protein SAMN05192533_10448 [Mesobacillus persicus]|uniref:Uncharacterized protein n=1 Tax=Mesobacillus persicus TaxID=930146 RepID=A0A1H7ZQL3_9BACI|nr:hypothetical protein [Mesobacillus persicus]SEM60700.1 hypothetical protein SAMN05192533_10448 [Mesobacillus persicus]